MSEKEKEITRFYEIGAKKKRLMKEYGDLVVLENNIEFLAQTLEPIVVANMEKEKFERLVKIDRSLLEYIKNFLTREETILKTLKMKDKDFSIPNLDKLNTLAKYFLMVEEKGYLYRMTPTEIVLRA